MTLAAELAKLRALPTPRVILAICFGLTALAAVIVLAVQPSDKSVYVDVPTGPASIVTMIGSIVFGAWLFGVEFGQGTLRRVLTTEPRREVVLATKALVVALGTAVFAAALLSFAAVLAITVASFHTVEIDATLVFNAVPSITIQATLVALMAGAFTVLFRSYSGGMIASFAMIFVIDGILGIWQALRDYTFGTSLASIDAIFDGTPSEPVFALVPTILIALAWIAAIAIPGAIRFLRGDFK